jgi:hypothetical protein
VPHTDIEIKEWTLAYDIQAEQARLIPALFAYPVLRGLSPLSNAGLGISSGMSMAEAICKALLKICQHLTITQITGAQKPYPQVNLAAAPLTSEGTRLRHMLEKIDETVAVYDLTGTLQVPTFAMCVQNEIVACSTHFDVAQAILCGLEKIILRWQIGTERFLATDRAVFPDLPAALRDDTLTVPRYTIPLAWTERLHWLQQILQKNGWRILVVPLNHEPSLQQIQPYIVHALLARY